MSAPNAPRSADDQQVHFSDYLKNKPLEGNDPPRSIRARDLDTNFARATVIEPPDMEKPPYRVEYSNKGTFLTDISGLPPDAIAKQFGICEDGEPKLYWFIVWEEEPELPSSA